MSSSINKKTIGHLSELARLNLEDREEEKLLKDLQKIVSYFDELQKLDTSHVEPMTGGSAQKNILREDGSSFETNIGEGVKLFPEEQGGFLKVPPVFE